MKLAIRAVPVLLLTIFALSGCKSSSLTGTMPATNSPIAPQGLRYYAGRDVVMVKVDVTETTSLQLNADLAPVQEKKTTREGVVTLNTVADTNHPFVVDLRPGGRFDNTLLVEVRPNGLLKSINAQSTGKAGDAIVSLAKFAGTIAGAPAIFGLGGQGTECAQNPHPSLAALPRPVRATIESDAVACGLFREIVDIEKEAATFEAERRRLERMAPTASTAELTLNGKRIAAIKEALDNLDAKHTAKQALLLARVEQFVKTNKLGTTTKTTSFSDMLDLAKLPPHAVVKEDMPIDQVKSNLGSYEEAKAVFERTGAVVTIDPIPSWAVSKEHPAAEGQRARIYFRQGQPLRVKLLVRSDCGNNTECMKILSDQVLDVLHSQTGVQFLEFEENAFAQRKLVLAFDEKGRPEKLERSGTSELAAITSTLSTAATTLRDEFATTLTKVEGIQASQRNIEFDDMTSELNRLKKEKEILDARIAVEGTSLNFANTVEQNRLNQELATLQASIALESAQTTAEQSIEIARLKSATALLVEEVNLIKAQIAAEQARR